MTNIKYLYKNKMGNNCAALEKDNQAWQMNLNSANILVNKLKKENEEQQYLLNLYRIYSFVLDAQYMGKSVDLCSEWARDTERSKLPCPITPLIRDDALKAIGFSPMQAEAQLYSNIETILGPEYMRFAKFEGDYKMIPIPEMRRLITEDNQNFYRYVRSLPKKTTTGASMLSSSSQNVYVAILVLLLVGLGVWMVYKNKK